MDYAPCVVHLGSFWTSGRPGVERARATAALRTAALRQTSFWARERPTCRVNGAKRGRGMGTWLTELGKGRGSGVGESSAMSGDGTRRGCCGQVDAGDLRLLVPSVRRVVLLRRSYGVQGGRSTKGGERFRRRRCSPAAGRGGITALHRLRSSKEAPGCFKALRRSYRAAWPGLWCNGAAWPRRRRGAARGGPGGGGF